jgi:hypothetical protein
MRRSLPLTVALLALGAAAPAHAGSTAARSFERFGEGARGSGKLTLTLRYRGDAAAKCEQHGTCGLEGTVVAKLRLRPSPRTSVARRVIVLQGRGTVTAAGGDCTDRRRLEVAGISFRPASHGDLLLRPGVLPSTHDGDDPFAAGCEGPSMADLPASKVLPAVRVKDVPERVADLRIGFQRRRAFRVAGFSGSVEATGKLRLRS